MPTPLETFVAKLPKVELHLHIEGSLEPEMLWEKAQQKKIELPFQSVEEIREARQFKNLDDFLALYYQGMQVLETEDDFYDLTAAYLKKISTQNVMHTEIFFDPQEHTRRGIAFETPLQGIERALKEGQQEYGISSHIIMCFLRHLSEDEALATLEQALPYKGRILGVGLDSSEKGFPPSNFERVFTRAREAGFLTVAHAGEEGPPEYVWQALDLLKVSRLDHGNRSLEDTKLVARLVEEGMALTVCPLSNLKLCGVPDMESHPLKKMLDLGLKATVNSDDPAYFGGYMTENYMAVTHALGLDRTHLVTLARNGIEASFADNEGKRAMHYRLDKFVEAECLPPRSAPVSTHGLS